MISSRAVYRPGDAIGDRSVYNNGIDEWPTPSLPGFWPMAEDEQGVWEDLCGEKLVLYGADRTKPGFATVRQFAYFSVCNGPVLEAVECLRENLLAHNSSEFKEKFPTVKLLQGFPSSEDSERLPIPVTGRFRHANRKMGQPANVRTLISAIIAPGATHTNAIVSIAFLKETDCLLFLEYYTV